MKIHFYSIALVGALLSVMFSMCHTPQKSTEVYFEKATPESVGMSSEKLANADAVINEAVDPINKVGIVLLAHRVHPVDTGSVGKLRTLVCNAVGAAVIE